MAPQRLSPLDVSFLHVEDEVSHMHLGSIGMFEGPAPSEDELLRAIEAKLHLAPRWRQRVRFVPLEAGRPVWVDDPHSICPTTCAAPGSRLRAAPRSSTPRRPRHVAATGSQPAAVELGW